MVITWTYNLRTSTIPHSELIYLLCGRFSLSWIPSIILHQTYINLTDVLTCFIKFDIIRNIWYTNLFTNLILFAILIHTPKISRQSFKYVTFGDEQTVHLTLSLKKGKCMVFKPRQVQDVRIVKFKEILVIHIMTVRVQRRQIFFWVIMDENLNWNSHNSNFSQLKFCHSISHIFLVFSYSSNPSP